MRWVMAACVMVALGCGRAPVAEWDTPANWQTGADAVSSQSWSVRRTGNAYRFRVPDFQGNPVELIEIPVAVTPTTDYIDDGLRCEAIAGHAKSTIGTGKLTIARKGRSVAASMDVESPHPDAKQILVRITHPTAPGWRPVYWVVPVDVGIRNPPK